MKRNVGICYGIYAFITKKINIETRITVFTKCITFVWLGEHGASVELLRVYLSLHEQHAKRYK